MSVTGHNPVRQKDDFYATPAWCVEALLPHLPKAKGIMDPCCGNGAILKVLRHVLPASVDLWGIEIDPKRALLCQRDGFDVGYGDALTLDWDKPEMVLTNPPFSMSMRFVEEAFHQVAEGGTIAMLLRLPWLASMKRAEWLRKNTPSVYVLPRRPSFTGTGTDATDYAWMVWNHVRSEKYGHVPIVQILNVPGAP